MFRSLSLLVFIFSISFSFSQQLIINEVSQGTGTAEYVEFVVIGTPGCQSPAPCIDLRHVIIDDNNGYFAPGGGTGVAPGAIRFSNDAIWSCVPQGTYIVVYNESSRNSAIPPDDMSLNDGNCRLILPASSSFMEGTSSDPNSSNPLYPPNSDWTVGSGSWSSLAMNNANDSFQIPDLSVNGTPIHSVSWGNNSNNTIIYFSGGAGSKVFSFVNAVDNNWNSQSNWVSGDVSTNQTPGAANSAANDAFIGSMNPQCGIANGIDISLTAQHESCLNACDGIINSQVSGGNPPYQYSWSEGSVSSDLNDLCPGNYNLTVTDNSGCTSSESVEINAGNNNADATITNPPGQLTDNGSPIQLSSLNPNGTWTADCGSCITAGGVFDPQLSGAGTFLVCYSLGSGNCADEDCISIVVTEDCQPQQTSEILTICEGSTVLVFGEEIGAEGNYSETFTDMNDCDSTHTISVNIYPSFNENNIHSYCFDDTVNFEEFVFTTDTIITLTYVDNNGCLFTSTDSFIFEDCSTEDLLIYVPNVFTPNGDGTNDLFMLHIDGAILHEGSIYNRWGNKIHDFTADNLVWNGKSANGENVQDGVYTYIFTYTKMDGVREQVHGFVTVIR